MQPALHVPAAEDYIQDGKAITIKARSSASFLLAFEGPKLCQEKRCLAPEGHGSCIHRC